MKAVYFRLAGLTTLLSFLSGSPQVQAQGHAINYVAAFKQAQERRMEADRKLRLCMEDVADWLVKFRLKTGHFPEPGVEQDEAKEILQRKILSSNPYQVTTGPAKACPIRFVMYLDLNQARLSAWQKSPPNDWKTDPGTVTAIMNSHDFIVLWGASAESSPIREPKNNSVSLVWREMY